MNSSLGGTEPYGNGNDRAPYEPPHNPYQPPGFGGSGAAPGQRPASLDGVSIAGMVCALTCCAAPVGIGLGIAGIVRTKNGRRRGRWAAVTGLVVGIIATLGLVAGGIGVGWYATNVVYFDEARAGDCVNVNDIDVWKAGCEEAHDAEVLYSGEFDDESLDAFDTLDLVDFCRQLPLDERYVSLFDHDIFAIEVRRESFDVGDPDGGDLFLCLASRTDGEAIEERLLGSAYASGAPDNDGYPDAGEEADIGWLVAGQCFDEINDEGWVEVVDCAEPHDGETIAEFYSSSSGDYPGVAALERQAERRCRKLFEKYVGAPYGTSPYNFGYWYPTEQGWVEDANKSINCVAHAPEKGEKLTGSVKNSGTGATISG